MSAEYCLSGARTVELSEAQADCLSMTDDELSENFEAIADKIGREAPCHFVVFNEDGLHMGTELCSRIYGSAVSVYLVFDDIFGPEKRPYLEEMNAAGMLISMNEASLQGHRVRYGYRLERKVVIPLPMIIPGDNKSRPISADCVILTVARLVDVKGYVAGLIKTLARIQQTAGLRFRLIIVGDGPLRSKLEKDAESSGIGCRIEFVGTVPYAELKEYYVKADIYVGMGTTVLEAASAGVPAIVAIAYTENFLTTGVFGSDEGLDLGEPFCEASITHGKELLEGLIRSPQARKISGFKGRTKVIEQFGQDVVMRNFLGHLDQNALQLAGLQRPKHRPPFFFLRRMIKRSFGYNPWIMWTGRKALLACRHMQSVLKCF
jgi:glycosyltransferase involved in cell wall biosynthesis